MDAEQLKITIPLIVPIIKELIEHYISPKVKEMVDKKVVSMKMTAHSFENQFEQYLINSYNKYSFVNILVLGNQQKKLDDIYIPLEVFREKDKNTKYVINNFDNDFIPYYKKVLITDTAGMGKSTIAKKLFLAAVEQKVGVPLLIELRRLSNTNRVIDEIFRQLSLINKKVDELFVLELIQRGGFVFIFDGFDEIEKHKRTDVIEDIANFKDKANKNYFLLTSRPEDALVAFGDFMQFNIRPLLEEEAYELLKKYDSEGDVSKLLINKISEKDNESVKEFLTNPLLVSLLFAAFEAKHTIPLKKHMFYRQVYDAFFEKHDLTKGESYTRTKYTQLESDDFHQVMRYMGYSCTRINKIEFNKDEIIKLIEDAKNFCVGLNFKANDFLNDIVSKVPLFIVDGLYYRWAHKSIQEYFSASFIYTDAKTRQGPILIALSKNNEYRYNNLIDIYYSIDFKTYRRYVIHDLLKSYFQFSKEIKHIWPGINIKLIFTLFKNTFLFIKYKSTAEENSRFNEILSKVRRFQSIPSGLGTYTMFLTQQAKFGYVKALKFENEHSATLDFLLNKNVKFIKTDFDKDSKMPNKDALKDVIESLKLLNMSEEEVYVLHGRDSNKIFKKYNINKLMEVFIFAHYYIDTNEAEAVFNSIEAEIVQEQAADFLMSGL